MMEGCTRLCNLHHGVFSVVAVKIHDGKFILISVPLSSSALVLLARLASARRADLQGGKRVVKVRAAGAYDGKVASEDRKCQTLTCRVDGVPNHRTC